MRLIPMSMISAGKSTLLLFLFLVPCSIQAVGELIVIEGKVIKIKDGDTIEILVNNRPLTVRLAHIDCPEKRQPYGNAARQFIAQKCFGQKVRLISNNKYDRNKRLIAEVINEKGENINRELIKAGLAWHFKKYSSDSSYASLEETAKAQHKGLWKDEDAIAPWLWRKH